MWASGAACSEAPVTASPIRILARRLARQSAHALTRLAACGAGVFLRDGPAGMDLEPQAWAHHRKPGASQSSSPYPAQVRWRALKMCKPIHESLWRDVPTTKQIRNGSQPIYELFMNAQQAQRLAELCLRHG